MAKRRKPVEEEHEVTWTTMPRFPSTSVKHAYLLVLAGPQFGEMFPLAEGRELVIGRRDDADVQIRDDGVSRRHATVRVEGEGAVLRDEGSANGTYVDGARVPEARVGDGARIQVGGHTTLKFVWADEVEALYQMRLAEGALQDPLTGLYNRRHLDDRLGSELAASLRHGRAMSLLMIDIDHFKEFNDTYGHATGDRVLQTVARAMKDALRKPDICSRHGGEEFAVLLPNTPGDNAYFVADRVRKTLGGTRYTGLGLPPEVNITISVGVATCPRDATVLDELMELSDKALYRAKADGRDMVVLWGAEERERVRN
jgi:diguanylate cyclase (GGDEF)-like protein